MFEFIGDHRNPYVKELFENWHKTLVEYEEILTKYKDLPYWNNERTNIGLVATASIKIGAKPLEEYSIAKGKGVEASSGRADLWIRFSDGAEFDFEAKQIWVSLNYPQIATSIINSLESAMEDVENLKEKSKNSVGIVFVIPSAPPPAKEVDVFSFKQQLKNIASYGGDFAALHFYDKEWISDPKDGYIYPGISVVGKYYKINGRRVYHHSK
jgi:hypothetical protein